MHKILKSMMVASGLVMLMTGAVHAKDEPKKVMPAATAAAATPAAPAAPAATATVVPTEKASAEKAPAAAKAAALMDINTASAKELASLPKVGDVKAAAIIKGRPYKAKDELVGKKILTADTYAAVKDQIIAKQKTAKK